MAYNGAHTVARFQSKTVHNISSTTNRETAKFEDPIFRRPKATDACFTAKENPGTKRPIQFAINSK